MTEISPSGNKQGLGSTLLKVWLYGTAFIGNCSCLGLVISFLLLASVLSTVGNAVNDISKEVSTSGKTSDKETVVSDEGSSNKIVVISVNGVISDSSTSTVLSSDTGASSGKIIADLDAAESDNDVKAVILDVNSPGGGVVASSKIYEKVKAVKEKKPVIALFGETAASGGYYISAPTSAIVSNADTFTGSIGVIMSLTNMEELYGKIGLKEVVFKSAQFKDIGSGTRPVTDAEKAILQGLINDAYAQFKSIVKEGRNLTDAQLEKVDDGRVFNGKQAKDLGLVDELGNFETAIRVAKQKANIDKANVVEYKSSHFLSSLLNGSSKNLSLTLFGQQPSATLPPSNRLLYMWDGSISQ
ncbi:MAG: signal peptide peptidase SppA [bacterium]